MREIILEAVPDKGADFSDSDIGGAIIKCFYRDGDKELSKSRALNMAKFHRWTVIKIEYEGEFDHAEANKGDADYEYIQEALSDGESIIFHTWPLDHLE